MTLKSTAYYFSIVFALLAFSFGLFHAFPTDPARTVLGPNATEKQISEFRRRHGLDRPLALQFTSYVSDVLRGDFGRSFVDQRRVFPEVFRHTAMTLLLLAAAMVFAGFYCLISLVFSDHDALVESVNFLFVSTPSFFSALLIALFAAQWVSPTFVPSRPWLLLIPAFAIALYPMAILSRILMAKHQEFMTSSLAVAQHASGLPGRVLRFKSSLRLASPLLVAAVSAQLPVLLTGTFIVENIFSVPGLGRMLARAVLTRDFPMVQAAILFSGMFFILVQITSEGLIRRLDPRVARGEVVTDHA